MAIIKIQLINDAFDQADADAMVPDRTFYCRTMGDAEMALGLIEREENWEDEVEEVTEF